MSEARHHFQQGGANYAAHRPSYPAALVDWLVSLAPDQDHALDVGCGSGQFTKRLIGRFARITAADVSADQLASAPRHPSITYHHAGSEALPCEDGSVSQITVAQAAHWFDLSPFYKEVRRVAKPGAHLALITYQGLQLPDDLKEAHAAYYDGTSVPYWPPERAHVEAGYQSLDFPFEEITPPTLRIEADWSLDAILGYMETWSATKRLRAAGEGHLMDTARQHHADAWPEGAKTVPVYWDLPVRVGRIK